MSSVDTRDIATGRTIPSEAGYADQPYVVVNPDGSWLCVMTTGSGQEGHSAQYIVATRSEDQGRTWSEPVPIEPPGPPEASWVMPLLLPGGRIYAFYVFNAENLRSVPGVDGSVIDRVDTLGALAFRFSDDGGRTWSSKRYEVPMRNMRIDDDNMLAGKTQFFWCVGKPIIHDGIVYLGSAKVGDFAKDGFMHTSEGVVLRSDNLATEPDPERVRWELLPDGDHGLRAPDGPIADETNLVALSDGSLFATYRSIDGFLCQAYSRDGGHSWETGHATYAPGGRRIKHPHAAGFVRRFANGNYVLWFHNHGGRYFQDRNPVWLCGGVERDGHIRWSEPEIVLYDKDERAGISYPDFVEQEGRYFITETQKTIARVHEIDPALLSGMWRTPDGPTPGAALSLTELDAGARLDMPRFPDLLSGGGFSLDLWVTPDGSEQLLWDTRNRTGIGMTVALRPGGVAELTIADKRLEDVSTSDPGSLEPGRLHHIVITVDGGPKVVTYVVDGKLHDGGAHRSKGWHRFHATLEGVDGRSSAIVASPLASLRVYTRALRTYEAVANHRAGASS